MIALRSWDRLADTTAVQRLASQLWPRGPHAGGVGWEAAIDQLPAATVLAEAEGQLVGWAGRHAGELAVQADPACPEAALTLLRWATAKADSTRMTLPIFDGDEMLKDVAISSGFCPTDEPVVGMFRPASPERPRIPVGEVLA